MRHLGGLAAVLISVEPVQEAWAVQVDLISLMCLCVNSSDDICNTLCIEKVLKNQKLELIVIAAIIIAGIVIIRITSEPSIEAIEGVNPATTGFLRWT